MDAAAGAEEAGVASGGGEGGHLLGGDAGEGAPMDAGVGSPHPPVVLAVVAASGETPARGGSSGVAPLVW